MSSVTALTIAPKEMDYLRAKFRGYYREHLVPPRLLHEREFGFGFERKIEYRHKQFESAHGLQEFIQRESPFFISYSAAYYRYPGATPMGKKEPHGAELIFDLDAGYEHENHNPMLCTHCLNKVREETHALVEDYLLGDFGFSKKNLSINFSGQKGYHVHVDDDSVRSLSQEARKQLSNYVTAQSLDMDRVFVKQDLGSRKYVLRGPTSASRGWSGRVYAKARGLVERGNEEEMKKEGLSKKQINFIKENQALMIQNIDRGNWGAVKGLETVWRDLLQRTMQLKSVNVDERVSYDMVRLIRMPQSLHGDTGFIAKTMSQQELPTFDPTKEALAFSRTARVRMKMKEAAAFELQGESYALKKEEEKELPENVAVLLLCKKKAILV